MASPQSSKAYQVIFNDHTRNHMSPTLLSNLVETSVSKPSPGPGEVLVRIHAAALNFRDLLVLANSPLYTPTQPGISPLADGSGTIEATGPNSKWANSIGQGVILVTNNGWIDGDDPSDYRVEGTLGAGDVHGTLREYAVVKDHLLLKKPANLGFEEAAAIVACVGTAMNALGSVVVGERTSVLTQGTGGVSCAVIQLASALGARVIATSSSDEKLQAAKKLGAAELINYKTTPNWAEEVLRLTDGKGVDLVAEVGGSATILQSIEAVKIGGTVSLIGFLSQGEITTAEVIPRIIFGAKNLKGIRGNSKAMLERGVKLVEEHDLHPIINTYEWSDSPKAFEDLRKANSIGKLVIRV